jgi:hypothetical protein
MAASEVARLHGVRVVDLAGMVFGLEPRQYLQDQHHPNKVRSLCHKRLIQSIAVGKENDSVVGLHGVWLGAPAEPAPP